MLSRCREIVTLFAHENVVGFFLSARSDLWGRFDGGQIDDFDTPVGAAVCIEWIF